MNSFIPWVGGKGKLLWIINKLMPDRYHAKCELFNSHLRSNMHISAQICNISMNAVLFRRFACRLAAFLAVWGRQ